MKEKKIVWGVFIFSCLVWFLDVYLKYPNDWQAWVSRKEMLNLTGVLAFIPMGIVMILAFRPSFLEKIFNGLDKMYYVHKWLGIFSIVFVVLHYGAKLGKSFWAWLALSGAKVDSDKFAPLSSYRSLAETTGEVFFYLFVAMLIVTLLSPLPYRIWRYIHKLISILFIGGAFHTIVLMPARYWHEPVGFTILAVSVLGGIIAVLSFFGLIGKYKEFKSEITAVEHHNDITLITCKINGNWAHKAGQYAFLQHQNSRESHPFTIASNDDRSNTVKFAIKALGHYTDLIQHQWKQGDTLTIEGPYGNFLYDNNPKAEQIWIAGGVGITPFIAWLESLQDTPIREKTRLYYCVNQPSESLDAEYLTLLANNAGIQLTIIHSNTQGYLDPTTLGINADTMIYFCGPEGLAKSIKKEIRRQGLSIAQHFHSEYFNMR